QGVGALSPAARDAPYPARSLAATRGPRGVPAHARRVAGPAHRTGRPPTAAPPPRDIIEGHGTCVPPALLPPRVRSGAVRLGRDDGRRGDGPSARVRLRLLHAAQRPEGGALRRPFDAHREPAALVP